MKNTHLSLSVPKLLTQMTIAYFIGFLFHLLFFEEWIGKLHVSNWMYALLGLFSSLLITAPIFYLIVYRDLKKKSMADQHLLEEFNQLKVILDDSPIGGFIYGEEGFIYVNKKYCGIYGLKECDIAGKKLQEAHPIDASTEKLLKENIKNRMAGQFVPEHYTVSLLKKNGERIYLEIWAKLSSLNGSPVILGSIVDVTEKTKLETSLKNSEQLYRRIFESNMDIAAIMDTEGILFDINKAGVEVFGYERSDIIGQSFKAFFDEDSLQEAVDNFEKALLGKSIRYESNILDKEGKTVAVAISIMPLTTEEGKVTSVFAFIRNISEQRQHLETIQRMAYYDSLTGLPNRHYFVKECDNLIERAEKSGERVALLYLDLDRLKVVNDNLGHFAGDELLQKTSERFREVIKNRGFISRLGGDEFTVIFPFEKKTEEVKQLAKELLASFRKPIEIEGVSIHSRISIGIGLYPEHGKKCKTLVQSADTAMFQAKRLGGNQYKLYNPTFPLQSQKLFEFENDFSRSIQNREFYLVYQPKVAADTLKITAVEALIRWKHPVRGIVPPSEFISMAETTGLIVPLGEWVLREACLQAKKWQEMGLPPLRMAVNVSALQFQQRNFPSKVQAILTESGIDAKWLEIEITEGTLMEENEVAHNGVSKLKEMGIYISLDDFGVGYSSMKYLKNYRMQALKIDRSFIEKVDYHEERAAIVKSIIQLAHGLKMQVVAEGVETAEELEFSQRHGIDEIQGYYISKPLQAEEIPHFITALK